MSFGFEPGQPPSMYPTPSVSSHVAIFSRSSTVSEIPSCCAPSRNEVS